MNMSNWYKPALIFIFCILLCAGCTEKYPSGTKDFSKVQESSCTVCHLDAELLEAVADPLPEGNEPSGEG